MKPELEIISTRKAKGQSSKRRLSKNLDIKTKKPLISQKLLSTNVISNIGMKEYTKYFNLVNVFKFWVRSSGGLSPPV